MAPTDQAWRQRWRAAPESLKRLVRDWLQADLGRADQKLRSAETGSALRRAQGEAQYLSNELKNLELIDKESNGTAS